MISGRRSFGENLWNSGRYTGSDSGPFGAHCGKPHELGASNRLIKWLVRHVLISRRAMQGYCPRPRRQEGTHTLGGTV